MKIKKKSNTVRVPPLKKAIKVKRKSFDTEEESTVTRAIETVKNVFKKKNVKPKETILTGKNDKSAKLIRSKKKDSNNNNNNNKRSRGIVYLGHIPHGFYEEEMADYFKQFGNVTRVRVVRSKNSGRSRGYGYVEFLHEEVAKIAAETMNNYLMCGRLLKATYIPSERQHKRFFVGRPWTKDTYPKLLNRNKITKQRNEHLSKQKHSRFVQSTKDKLHCLEKKLNGEGIQLDFMSIVKSN